MTERVSDWSVREWQFSERGSDGSVRERVICQ